ncbi:hypothetical protein HIM_02979 [Hirsutella minnesotensis 3608]|nr:hypothetical protein HIM_02979 [Hirsutella minnesotensis 3608]
MPPRPIARRRTRLTSHEPDSSPPSRAGGLASFQKPNLPPLQATPSSRRQYSYGAAAEPPASRPSRGHQREQSQLHDLSNAVRDALIRHNEEELYDDPQPRSRARIRSVDPDEDELAGSYEPASQPLAVFPRDRRADEEDPDDTRSFAIESDFYGDATIASSPEKLPSHQATRFSTGLQPRSNNIASAQRPQSPAKLDAISRLGSLHPLPHRPSKPQLPASSISKRQSDDENNQDDSEDDDDGSRQGDRDESGDDESPLEKFSTPQRTLRTNTPAVNGLLQARPKESLFMPKSQAAQTNQNKSITTSRPQTMTNANQEKQAPAPAPRRSLRINSVPPTSQAQERRQKQQDETESERSSESGRWVSGATKASAPLNTLSDEPSESVKSLSSGENEAASDEQEREPAIDWWQLFNPWTYFQAIVWMMEASWKWLTDVVRSRVPTDFRRHIPSTKSLPHIAAGFIAFVLLLAAANSGLAWFRHDPMDDLWSPSARDASWFSPSSLTRTIGSYLPKVSWSGSRTDWDDISGSWDPDDSRHETMNDFLAKTERAFRALVESGKLHETSLKTLETVVPKIVYLELKDGKPVVAPEFWHALRTHIRDDGGFMTFDKKGNEYAIGSDRQWKAIASRLDGDPTFTKKIDVSIRKLEQKLDGRLTEWESWVRNNDAKVKESLDTALQKVNAAGSAHAMEQRVGGMIKDHVREREREGTFISRDEFIRLVQSEVASHNSEIREELAQLQPRLEKMVKESVALAKGGAPSHMSREEITALVNGLLRKGLADINLEALANGKIHAHWDTELRNQINYFSTAQGAIIDPKHSAVTYKPPHNNEKPRPQLAALQSWEDDGDCWCAARSRNRRGNPHGASLAVQLGYSIIPQHFVVEHILPGATMQPGARPRDIELYASIMDEEVRERVRDFSATHFPPDTDNWDHAPADLPERFVKISQLVYEGAELHDGVHVHRLSSELIALGAATDHVIVRATSNYGAANHTCFYRVRLYGVNVDVDVHSN